MSIDVNFDFTSDTPGYWDSFWENDPVLGHSFKDPDGLSKKMHEYHRLLWSRELPNGDIMNLREEKKYLVWKNFYLSPDSIIVSFRNGRGRPLVEKALTTIDNPRQYIEDYLHKSYTIGGSVVFPVHINSMNQRRGCSVKICDRWDLTLECIRRHYAGEESPLSKTTDADRAFYDLFIDFKGFIDFFLLNDCVSSDYSKVDIWLGKGDFNEKALPQTVEEYFTYINCQLEFLKKRNERIAKFANENLK